MSLTETKIESIENFRSIINAENTPMHHFAVQRKCYRHHFILLRSNCLYIVQYTSKYCIGRVGKERYSGENFERDMQKGLYHFESDDYPKSDAQFAEAGHRLEERLKNETSYSLATNNCKHLVTHILTGTPVSYQVENAPCLLRCLIDTLDLFTVPKDIRTSCVAIAKFFTYIPPIGAKITQMLGNLVKCEFIAKSKNALLSLCFLPCVQNITPQMIRVHFDSFVRAISSLLGADTSKCKTIDWKKTYQSYLIFV